MHGSGAAIAFPAFSIAPLANLLSRSCVGSLFFIVWGIDWSKPSCVKWIFAQYNFALRCRHNGICNCLYTPRFLIRCRCALQNGSFKDSSAWYDWHSDVSIYIYIYAIALRIDDASVHVCPHLPFILAFRTIEHAYIWNPLRVNFGLFVSIFCSLNSHCALLRFKHDTILVYNSMVVVENRVLHACTLNRIPQNNNRIRQIVSWRQIYLD